MQLENGGVYSLQVYTPADHRGLLSPESIESERVSKDVMEAVMDKDRVRLKPHQIEYLQQMTTHRFWEEEASPNP